MDDIVPARFAFVRRLYPELAEADLIEAEARYARLLDILSDVADEAAQHCQSRAHDSTAPGSAPYDASPPSHT